VPFFASIIIVSQSADGVICCSEDLAWCEDSLAIYLLKVYVDGLNGINGIIHEALAIFDAGQSYFTISI
jgi:hypothetical protein